jgi:hypothetical protein
LTHNPSLKGHVQILSHVTDAELDVLIKNCLFTVFPSTYEGWGLPISESLSYGKYCLASDSSSHREVGYDLIDYLDPWDVPAWAEKLTYLFTHPEYVKKKETHIRKKYKPHSWHATCQEIYKTVVK